MWMTLMTKKIKIKIHSLKLIRHLKKDKLYNPQNIHKFQIQINHMQAVQCILLIKAV
jgi:hypothetical protein